MRPWMKRSLFFVLFLCILYFGYHLLPFYLDLSYEKSSYEVFDEEQWENPLEESGFKDNMDIYQEDEPVKVDELYITIMGNEEDTTVNNYLFGQYRLPNNEKNNLDSEIEVYFEDSSNDLLNNGIFVQEPNATIKLRGNVSEKILQKSYKIKLFDREGLWHNQNTLNLNKHYEDPLRIRNKLSFDYFKIIPDITSFRTRFVRVFIKRTENEPFLDYGFFTQIEEPNKLYLKNHGLDPEGFLYKAEDFNFSRYPEQIKNKENKTYSKKNFEEILQIEGSDNHQQLIDMLEAVNDYDRDINEIIETYFDKDNYLTWLATNILFDNYKTSDTNYMLYSPLNSNKWYFIPWDYDEAWGSEKNRAQWEKGIAVYWNNTLHRRFFQNPENSQLLNDKLDDLIKVINKEQTKKFLDSYSNIALANITKLPDFKYLPITFDDYKKAYEALPVITEENYYQHYELIEKPMPFYLGEPEYKENKIIFKWDTSFDIQKDKLYYDFELSRDKNFSNIILRIKDISSLNCETETLTKGIYYWRVTVRDEEGNSQIPYAIYTDEFNDEFYGIKKLVVK